MNNQEALTSYIVAFVAEMVQTGVKDVVVSPGSRSTPMAMVMAEHPDLRVHIHVDERSAAFFALGMAKASQNPVAILCTSGTAAANYYPAIVEACYARVPLMVLTADRPHELRDVGAPQAIDQIHMYGNHVKWFVEMAVPEKSEEMSRYARTVCARAAATALSAPAGPVHLNFPFREPLVPSLEADNLFELQERQEGYVQIKQGVPSLHVDDFHHFAQRLGNRKGIIVCGSYEQEGFTEAVIQLSEQLQFPILADPLSQLRSGEHDGKNIIDTYDTFLRNVDAKNALRPEVILRFGAMPVSKALTIYLKENKQAEQWVIDGGNGWRDPSLLSTSMIYCGEVEFCKGIIEASVAKQSSNKFLTNWQELNAFTKECLLKVRDIEPLSEGRLFQLLPEILPEGSTLFVGNSMPIRDLDTFFHKNDKGIKIMANRGANGIDGTISTALGAATILEPVYLVVGDLTFFHDLNGLIAAKLYDLNIKIIVINNNGGGIFSFLPQASHPKNFEKLFGTPLDLEFEQAVHMYGGSYDLIQDWEHFASSFMRNLENKGLSVMEITTNRDTNLKEHRDLWEFVSQEISRLLKGE